MALSAEFREFLLDLFSGMGRVEARRMFGGAGLYIDDACFAIVLGGERVMMRGDDTLADEFEADGGEQWVYQRKGGKPTAMPYWSLPESALDDPEEACRWAARALGPARKAAAEKAAAKARKEARKNAKN